MESIRILLVEDAASDIEACTSTIKRYERQKKRQIECISARTEAEAHSQLNGSYDGAIIDIKLKNDKAGTAGNDVISEIYKTWRIPIVVLTGTPENASHGCNFVGLFKKGEVSYENIFDLFYDIYNTGLTKIMGGRGKIEEELTRVFFNNLLNPKNKDSWITHGRTDSPKTEKALLRFTLNHLMQLLYDDEDECFPEEVYIHPPLQAGLRTGSIVRNKKDNNFFVVLTPPCDLVLRESGQIKTDKILLVEIDEEDKVYGYSLGRAETETEKQKILQTILNNRHSLFHHWLPVTTFFPGGFINFRKILSLNKKVCEKEYDKPDIQISPYFVKDILSRFSSYYARQGQPDIDCAQIISKIITTCETKKR